MPPLNIRLHRSLSLILILLLLHSGALFWTLYLTWPVGLKIVLVVLLGLSLWRAVLRCFLLLGPRVVVAMQSNDGLDWQLTLASGQIVAAQLQQSTYFPGCLAVLNFRQAAQWRVYSVVVMFDSTDRDSLRRLGVSLRTV